MIDLDFIKKIGIEDVELRINSVGCRECRPVYRKALQDYLRPYYEELSDISKDRFEANPMRIIDSKDITDQRIAKDAPYSSITFVTIVKRHLRH